MALLLLSWHLLLFDDTATAMRLLFTRIVILSLSVMWHRCCSYFLSLSVLLLVSILYSLFFGMAQHMRLVWRLSCVYLSVTLALLLLLSLSLSHP